MLHRASTVMASPGCRDRRLRIGFCLLLCVCLQGCASHKIPYPAAVRDDDCGGYTWRYHEALWHTVPFHGYRVTRWGEWPGQWHDAPEGAPAASAPNGENESAKMRIKDSSAELLPSDLDVWFNAPLSAPSDP